jgi:hypothetical protein
VGSSQGYWLQITQAKYKRVNIRLTVHSFTRWFKKVDGGSRVVNHELFFRGSVSRPALKFKFKKVLKTNWKRENLIVKSRDYKNGSKNGLDDKNGKTTTTSTSLMTEWL